MEEAMGMMALKEKILASHLLFHLEWLEESLKEKGP